MIRPSELLKLEDLAFLRQLAKRYPETAYLAGPAEASPEGNQSLKPDALVHKVFDADIKIDPTAIEADRTFLGLLTLKWVLNGDYDQFTALQTNPATRLSRDSFDKLRAYTQRIAGTEENLEFCLYSLACNDLGKTLFATTQYRDLKGRDAADHDLLLYELVSTRPALFPAFQTLLTPTQQQSYIKGLGANLNLGQFVQGENLSVNLAGMQAIDAQSRELRLVCELFDFAGVTGHVNAGGSLVMTEENYIAFSTAIAELTAEPLDLAYQRYIERRAHLVGLDPQTPEGFAMGRIAALSRAFNTSQGDSIRKVWDTLPDEKRRMLISEFNETGTNGHKGVLVYYAPAVIANAVKATGDFSAGLKHALGVFADVFERARADSPDQQGNGVITVNVADKARMAAQLPKTTGGKP